MNKSQSMDVLNATEMHLKLLTYKLCASFLTIIKGSKLIDLTKE